MDSDDLEWYARTRKLAPGVNLPYKPGDWRGVFTTLSQRGYLTSPVGLQNAIQAGESTDVIRALLTASNQDPGAVQIFKLTETGRTRLPVLAALLSDSRSIPEAENNRALMTTPRERTDVIDLLLGDERVSATLADTQRQTLAKSLASPIVLNEAIPDYPNLAMILLDYTDLPLPKRNALYVIASGDVRMFKIILDNGRVSPDEMGWLLEPLAKQKNVDIIRAVLDRQADRAFVSSLLWEAVVHDNSIVVREVLQDVRANPYLSISNLSELFRRRNAISQAGLENVGMLFRDRRVDVSTVELTPVLVRVLKPLIGERVTAAYEASELGLADYWNEEGSEGYALFLQTVILKRLSGEESLDWLASHPTFEANMAAANAVWLDRERGRETAELSDVEGGYLGFFLSLLYGLDLDESERRMRASGYSDLSVRLASGLVAAVSGDGEQGRVGQAEYELAMSAVFGLEER